MSIYIIASVCCYKKKRAMMSCVVAGDCHKATSYKNVSFFHFSNDATDINVAVYWMPLVLNCHKSFHESPLFALPQKWFWLMYFIEEKLPGPKSASQKSSWFLATFYGIRKVLM